MLNAEKELKFICRIKIFHLLSIFDNKQIFSKFEMYLKINYLLILLRYQVL
jgi:hypothetical protein